MASLHRVFSWRGHRRPVVPRPRHGAGRVPHLERLECRQLLAGDLAITEWMAANATTLLDEDDSAPDWIEIHNASTGPVDLAGWSLSDDVDNLGKWVFPSRVLDASEYLVVFASGKDRKSGDGELHTNFKLAAEGEYLALVSPAGAVVSEFGPGGSDYPPQSTDISYGVPADGGVPGYLESPTPNQPNNRQRSVSVEFDHPSGVFREPFSLTLAVDSPAAAIHFTTDGSEPTATSPIYTAPLLITSTTHVRALTVAPGLAASTETSAWYLTVDADLRYFTSDLPIMVLDNFSKGRTTGVEYQVNGLAIFEPDPISGRSSLFDVPTLETRSGAKARGAGTGDSEKASLALETWDEHNDDKAMSLLGMPSDSDWILYGPFEVDLALIRNTFIFELSNQVGRYAVRTRFVELYHNMTGGDVSSQDYRGLYVLMEKIKRGPDRVNIQELGPQHHQEPDISGGWMLKLDHSADPGDAGFRAAGMKIFHVNPKEADVTPAQAAWIEDYLEQMRAALSDPDPESGYAKYIDVGSWIDHHILNALAANIDALRYSSYFYKDRGGKIEYGPLWDFNYSMESANGGDDDPRDRFDLLFEHNALYPWWGRLFEHADFMQAWIDRWFELRQDVFTETHIASIIDSMAAEIQEAQRRNFVRWFGFRPRSVSPAAFDIGALDGTWQGEITQLKQWLLTRIPWIDSRFLTPPVIAPDSERIPVGQEIRIASTAGSVYFTTDGTDPRLPGGTISPHAVLADEESPLVFAGAISVVARTRAMVDDEWQWSAPVTVQFRPAATPDDAGKLAITEVNYHPHAPTDSELAVNTFFNARDFEFIELANTGAHAIDLTNVALTEGAQFVFDAGATVSLAAGQHVLVVANREAFETRYGHGLPVGGVFARGSLSNDGERIVLADRFGKVLQDFRYDTAGQWPDRAAGLGSTLEVISTAADYNDPANWCASSRYGGSPGLTAEAPIVDVLVNEVLTRDVDLVELYNRSADDIDVSGWYLTDEADRPDKARIPDATTLPAGGYLVLNAAALNLDLNGTHGGDLSLIESDGDGRPRRFVDRIEFDGTDAGVSLGRWPNGDPNGVVLPMMQTTFGTANSGARTGEVIISEMHYHHPELPAIYSNDFSDGTADGFSPVFGTWSVRDAAYEVTPGPEQDAITTIAGIAKLPTSFVLTLTMSVRALLDYKQNAAIIFDYHSPTEFKFVSIHANGDQWRIGQCDANGWVFLARIDDRVTTDLDIDVRIEVRGSSIVVGSDRINFGYDFETPLNDGLVGLGSKGGAARFDNLELTWNGASRNLGFLELVGTTGAAIDLEGWQLMDQDAVRLSFAPGTTLAADAALVAVDFDPGDALTAALFRDVFGIDESVALVGPFAGGLNTQGAVVRLLKPVTVGFEDPGMVLVDRVAYDTGSPWPAAAAGQGRALGRAAAAAPGHLPPSWSALIPTPGTVQFALPGDLDFDGTVDTRDVGGFARILADPPTYLAAYGVPATMVADVDGNGAVDFDDIDDFVALVGGWTMGSGVQVATESDGFPLATTVEPTRRATLAPVTAADVSERRQATPAGRFRVRPGAHAVLPSRACRNRCR